MDVVIKVPGGSTIEKRLNTDILVRTIAASRPFILPSDDRGMNPDSLEILRQMPNKPSSLRRKPAVGSTRLVHTPSSIYTYRIIPLRDENINDESISLDSEHSDSGYNLKPKKLYYLKGSPLNSIFDFNPQTAGISTRISTSVSEYFNLRGSSKSSMQSNVANTLVCSEYCRIESTGTPVLSTNGANDDISTSYTSFTEEPTTDSSIPVANTSINDNEGYTQARSYVQRQQSLIVDYHPHTIKHSLNRGSSAPLRPARPLNPVLSQISMDSLTRDVLDISDVSMISANSNLTRRTTDTVDKKIAPSSSHRLLHPRRHSVPGPKVLEAIADDPLSQKNRDSVRMKKKALKIIRFVRTLSRRGSDRV